MKVLIADFVYKLLATVGLRSFALQFLVSFILIGLLLVGAMAAVLAALATDDPSVQAMLLWLALAQLVAITLALFIGRIYGNHHFMDQVDRLHERLLSVADGDFSQPLRIEIEQNEVGQMLAAYNRMLAQVGGLLDQIQSAGRSVETHLAAVINTMEDTRTGAGQQNSEVYQVATAMNQMSTSIQDVAGNAQQAAASAQEANTAADEGQRVARQARERIDHLDARFSDMRDTMEGLYKDVSDVSDVVGIIGGIAEQTNLLALNAAIEAARAGESGRGFAVVADEVRNLANRTQDSTTQIHSTIENLQRKVQDAVSASETSAEASREGVEAVAATSEAIAHTLEAVATIQAMNDQIATAVEQQSQVAEDVNRRIGAISEVAEQTDQSANRTVEATQSIESELHVLQQAVERFHR